jgi:hypothetical protein
MRTDPLRPSGEGDAEVEDARIRLDLVRLYLDQERDAEALVELDLVERRLGDSGRATFRMERDALRSLLDVRRGDPAAAHQRLRKTLRQASVRSGRSWRSVMLQLQLGAERAATGEAYALLAIAAVETGHAADARWALAEAAERGIDVAELARAAAAP